MRRETKAAQNIKRMYARLNLDSADVTHRAKLLLKVYRDVVWVSVHGAGKANGVSLKEIQDWLGHSTFATTADIYAHLDKSTKSSTVNAMLQSGIRIGRAFGVEDSVVPAVL